MKILRFFKSVNNEIYVILKHPEFNMIPLKTFKVLWFLKKIK